MDKLKLYCYADETGPDTKGKMFLVAVVITTSELREAIERSLEDVEEKSGKGILKWRLTSISKKQSYLLGILRIGALQGSLFYTLYKDTKDYLKLVAKTLAKVNQEEKEKQAKAKLQGR